MADEKDIVGIKNGTDFSRRAFIKKTLLIGVAVASTAAVAKKVASVTPRQDLRGAYLNDEIQQDKVMKGKEYVVMSKEEKEQMLQMFVKEYQYTA
ncbi:MAG: hypothetical protein Q7T53_03575 [Deltaproteobacteria bacterium]|nr:hypothetical protein [Deltaproteobacteria bacterium]